MRAAVNIGDLVLKWLLIVGLAVSPLTPALSSFRHACENCQSMMAVEKNCHHQKDESGAVSAHDCCEQKCDAGSCGCANSAAHVSFFLLPVIQIPPVTSRPFIHAAPAGTRFGQVVSPLLHPPRL